MRKTRNEWATAEAIFKSGISLNPHRQSEPDKLQRSSKKKKIASYDRILCMDELRS